jgi:hypothetical protein
MLSAGDLVYISTTYCNKKIGIVIKVTTFESKDLKNLVWCLWESGNINYICATNIKKAS